MTQNKTRNDDNIDGILHKTVAEVLIIWATGVVAGYVFGGMLMAAIGMWIAVPFCILWINNQVSGHPLRFT